jgi:hypothetical protein
LKAVLPADARVQILRGRKSAVTAKDDTLLIDKDGLGESKLLIVLDQERDLPIRVLLGVASIGLEVTDRHPFNFGVLDLMV